MAEDLSESEVARIAALARLALTGEELRRFAPQLREVLSFASQIASVDTSGVGEADRPGNAPLERPDEVAPSLDADAALGNAPERLGDFFLTPRVLPGR